MPKNYIINIIVLYIYFIAKYKSIQRLEKYRKIHIVKINWNRKYDTRGIRAEHFKQIGVAVMKS